MAQKYIVGASKEFMGAGFSELHRSESNDLSTIFQPMSLHQRVAVLCDEQDVINSDKIFIKPAPWVVHF